MRHLFVMDPLEKLEPAMDTSLRIAFALHTLGQESYATTPWQLSWQRADKWSTAHCHRINYRGGPASASLEEGGQRRCLSEFRTIHMRKDPPFDMDYITATWLLDACPPETKVLNSPHGLRSVNEKAIILRYPEAIGAALISANPDEMLKFVKGECQGDAILKPLTLYSGKGIHRLKLTDQLSEDSVRRVLNTETNGGSQRLIQPFDDAIYGGEVRAFTMGGKAIAWCVKKPAPGEYMANSSFGSTRHAYRPSQGEINLVERISRDLQKYGIELVGYDLIGGKISEINVTSPRLLTAPGDDTDYYKTIAEWLVADAQ